MKFLLLLMLFLNLSLLNVAFLKVGKTVIDSESGLMWQDFTQNDTVQLNNAEAHAYCRALELQNHSDWRLPKSKTLKTLSENMHAAMDDELFASMRTDFFWSSTTYLRNATEGWIILLDSSDYAASHKDKHRIFSVICVRGNQK